MPFENSRRDRLTTSVNFDEIYRQLIAPAVAEAGLQSIRADQELQGGIFHKTMFERLATCEYAVADLSLSNPNVFYELGIRHALRPWSTILLFQEDLQLPLDVALDAAMTYPEDVIATPAALRRCQEQLTARLRAAETRQTDSPVFQLVAGLQTHEVDHRRADVLVESAVLDSKAAREILEAESAGPDALTAIYRGLGDLRRCTPEIVAALVMSLRAQQRWADMISAITAADPAFSEVWVMQEQLALALGRTGQYRRAVGLLERLLKRRPNSETFGLLGGVYKRQWRQARAEGASETFVSGLQRRAASTYRLGFECDWRDPYPGVNALMLEAQMDLTAILADPLVGAVRYAIDRRISSPEPEYWDYACALELAILLGDEQGVQIHLPNLLLRMEQEFQRDSTLDDLRELAGIWATRHDSGVFGWLLSEIETR